MAEEKKARLSRFMLDTDMGVTVTPPPQEIRELTDKAEAAADILGGLDADVAVESLKQP